MKSAFPADFRSALARQLEAVGQGESIRQRNPQEPFRQFFSARLRLAATLAECRRAKPFRDVAEFIAELAAAEQALAEMKAGEHCRNAGAAGALGSRRFSASAP